MVDASEGVLGIEWIEGKSVRFLLGGGAEGEEEIMEGTELPEEPELAIDDEDPLREYGVTQGVPEIYRRSFTHLISLHNDCRRYHADDWDRNCKDAPRGRHPRRPHHLKHDASSPFLLTYW